MLPGLPLDNLQIFKSSAAASAAFPDVKVIAPTLITLGVADADTAHKKEEVIEQAPTTKLAGAQPIATTAHWYSPYLAEPPVCRIFTMYYTGGAVNGTHTWKSFHSDDPPQDCAVLKESAWRSPFLLDPPLLDHDILDT